MEQTLPRFDAGPEESAENDKAAEYLSKKQKIDDLIAGKLSLAEDPSELFDIPLDDEKAVLIEIKRLKTILQPHTSDIVDLRKDVATLSQKHKRARRQSKHPQTHRPSALDSGISGGGDGGPTLAVDATIWQARLALDRSRLAFYLLPTEKREALLRQHAERQRVDSEARAAKQVSEAEQRARQAAREQKRAQEAAIRARTEAERLLAEERIHLLGIAEKQAKFEVRLVNQRQGLKRHTERTLEFRRRAREMKMLREPDPIEADALYQELRQWLRQSRDELATAISASKRSAISVPHPGSTKLMNLTVNLDQTQMAKTRKHLAATAHTLLERQLELNIERAKQLQDEVLLLNEDRLMLLPLLSAEKRNALVGFSDVGFDQALAETRQVMLVLRFHLHTTLRWLDDMIRGTGQRGKTAFIASWMTLKWLFAIVLFIWWRRRADQILKRLRDRLGQKDHRSRVITANRLEFVLDLLLRVRRPLEWLIFLWILVWFLPTAAQSLLEVRLVTTTFSWTLGGFLAVLTIDSIASSQAAARAMQIAPDVAATRLKSLTLVGRVVVAFGLILSISNLIVGKGTIYSWVFSTCWLAAIPIFLVIIKWWREIIFRRVKRLKKKKAFEQWVIRNQTGWKSFFMAVLAGVYLFFQGIFRAVTGWVGRFDITRRLLAHLFRRGLDRIAENGAAFTFERLPDGLFTQLGPETPSKERVDVNADAKIEQICDSINRPGGGVFAVIGERGAGKTTVLNRVGEARKKAIVVDCPLTGLEDLRVKLARAMDIGAGTSLEKTARILNQEAFDTALLIDNSHRLIHPMMGGLLAFDQLIDVARRNSSQCSWFFAFDEVIWRFLKRARGERPLFDAVIGLEGWSEEEIARLLVARSRQAGITPSFERLLQPGAPIDSREEELELTAARYYRLIWDYTGGNPAIALHLWRRSLGLDAQGKPCVKIFQAPDARDLEDLPEEAIFVLRAVVQIDWAKQEEIQKATLISTSKIQNVLRYGIARGYITEDEGRYEVTWAWFRAITRFLQRRHLLAALR